MADSFKLKALKAVTAALKEIIPANGYEHDLADFDPGDGVMTARVYRGRAWFGENDPIPLVCILERPDPDGAELVAEPPVDTPVAEYDWDLLIQGFVQDDPENPTDPAYTLLAECRQCLIQERKRKINGDDPDPFGLGLGKNRIVDVRVLPGVVRPADDVSAKAWFFFTLRLRIIDNASDPFA